MKSYLVLIHLEGCGHLTRHFFAPYVVGRIFVTWFTGHVFFTWFFGHVCFAGQVKLAAAGAVVSSEPSCHTDSQCHIREHKGENKQFCFSTDTRVTIDTSDRHFVLTLVSGRKNHKNSLAPLLFSSPKKKTNFFLSTLISMVDFL